MKAATKLTHISNPSDTIYLKTEAFPVNIRLAKSDVYYGKLISVACECIRAAMWAKYDDYKKPHGMSGANLAIPFNIIGYFINRGKKDEEVEIMINPKIIETEGRVEMQSNCGSIRLSEPITVGRHEEIIVGYYDEEFNYKEKDFDAKKYGATIQHEIDHNNGILITDRQV